MTRIQKPLIIIDYQAKTIEVALSYLMHTENNWYFAECPELQLVDQGKSPREAILNLTEMVKETLLEAIVTDNIDLMLSELGFTKRIIRHTKRKRFSTKNDSFENMHPLNLNVPLPDTLEMATISS